MRTFVKLRENISTHKVLAQKMRQLELKIKTHDENITALFDEINQLLAPQEKPKKIGFEVKENFLQNIAQIDAK